MPLPSRWYAQGGGPRIEQAVDLLLLLALAVAGLVALRREAKRGTLRANRTVIAATAGAALLALGVRLAVCAPTFLLPNCHGGTFVNETFLFPEPVTGLGSVGQASFLVLGAVARLFGRRFEVVVAANQVVGVLVLSCAGWLAARWTSRPWCAPLAVLLGALQPALARVAASEDPHNLAVLWGLLAFVAFDVYASSFDRLALVAATAADGLMVATHQTLYPWAPAIFAVAVARGGRAAARRPGLGIAAAAVAAVLVARLVIGRIEPIELMMFPVVFFRPSVLATLVIHHPLFDMARYALLLLPLEVYGAVGLGRVRRPYLALAAFTFLMTLPFGFPEPGMELSLRLPMTALALVSAAAGAERLFRTRWLGAGATAFAALSPAALSGFAVLRSVSPQLDEYRFVRDQVRGLPSMLALVELPTREPAPGCRVSDAMFPEARAVYRFDPAKLTAADVQSQPYYFLAGLRCRAYSVAELAGVSGRNVGFAEIQGLLSAPIEGHTYRDVRPPPYLRPECRALLAHAEPFGPSLVIEKPVSENPFLLYADAPPVTVQMVRLTAPPDAAPAPRDGETPAPPPEGPARR